MAFLEYLNTRLPNSAYQGCLWYCIREGKYLAVKKNDLDSYLQMCPAKAINVLSIKKSRISFWILFCWFRMSFDFVKWLIPSYISINVSLTLTNNEGLILRILLLFYEKRKYWESYVKSNKNRQHRDQK